MDQKIILGDAYKLIKDVPSGSVDLVFTDPPYLFDGINFVGWKGSCKSDIDMPTLKNGVDNASMLPELVRVLKKRGGAPCGATRRRYPGTSISSKDGSSRCSNG